MGTRRIHRNSRARPAGGPRSSKTDMAPVIYLLVAIVALAALIASR